MTKLKDKNKWKNRIVFFSIIISTLLSLSNQNQSIYLARDLSVLELPSLPATSDYGNIRKWGCNLKETPFVFVHIGKAGGGSIRRRIAASAFNFTRSPKDWNDPKKDTSYYPIRDDNGTMIGAATLCNSGQKQFIPVNQRTYETTQICSASTPIGQALTCPANILSDKNSNCGGDPRNTESARVVYLGHNDLGTEIHWLPVPYLERWWRLHWKNSTDHDAISELWQRLDPSNMWCRNQHRPMSRDLPGENQNVIANCGKETQAEVDKASFESIQTRLAMDTSNERGRAWSAVYASLPLIRVVMMRNPFSWLASRFAWHRLARKGVVCDNVYYATAGAGNHNIYQGTRQDKMNRLVVEGSGAPGWARRLVMEYLYNLCGSDCRVRHLQQEATLEELTVQAEYNLRRSFAVVGILEDGEESFLEMLDARVDYLDIQRSNTIIIGGGRHSSRSRGEYGRCKERFKDVKFQQYLLAASPEVTALVHLYQVAVHVNQFQKQELLECRKT